MSMRVGRHNHFVTLWRSPQQTNDADGFFEPLSPREWWVTVQPLSPQGDDRTTTSLVTMRYHSQVNMDTRILYGTRELFVKGIQDVDDRHVELRCLCEEITT